MNQLNYPLLLISIISLSLITSCNPKEQVTSGEIQNASSCRGEWTTSDEHGVNKRFSEFWNESLKVCLIDTLPLTNWETQIRTRSIHNIGCTPQAGFPTVRLKAANNFYTYRNDRLFIELDSSTGEYKKLERGESVEGEETFIREVGCFYVREDLETEIWGAKDFGLQILLDSELSASSNIFHPMQVFRILNMSGNWELTRFDDTIDWGYGFCPESSTPWGFCNLLRNGNDMFYPETLTNADKANLKAEAILIRTEFNFIEITGTDFDTKWNEAISEAKEYKFNWKYFVMGSPDIPIYIDRAWRAYIRGERPMMPETGTIRTPPLCYTGSRQILYPDGSTGRVFGEICYINGEYTFTGI